MENLQQNTINYQKKSLTPSEAKWTTMNRIGNIEGE